MTHSRLILEYFRRIFSAILFLFCFHTLNAQVTIFSENFGTPTGTTTLVNYALGASPATFQNGSPITFTGTGDIRSTPVSAGYVGASGGGNVFLTNAIGRDFIISGINTSSFVSLSLSFGVFKSTLADNGSALVVEVSSDGITLSCCDIYFHQISTAIITSTRSCCQLNI